MDLTPDYSRRKKVLQPQFQRDRAAFRSPISSAMFNLTEQQFRYDVYMLRAQLEALRTRMETNLDNLFNGKEAGLEAIDILFAKVQQFEDRIRRLEANKGF